MVALATAEFVDPTVFSPLTPPEGIHNWLGLPGALIGGSLLEILAHRLLTVLVSNPPEQTTLASLFSAQRMVSCPVAMLASILHVLVLTLEHNTVPFQGL